MTNAAVHLGEIERRDSVLLAVSLAATALAAGLIAASLYSAELELSDLGITRSYPVSFYAGLALLPVASSFLWFTRGRIDGIVVGQLIILILVIWLSPYLLEDTPRFRSAYKNFAAADYLLRGDGLSPDTVVYHNWPLLPGLTAGFLWLTRFDVLRFMGLFPLFIQLAYLVPIVALVRTASSSGDNRWWAGVWLFYLFNWTGQDYYSPQAFAFLIFLILLAVLARVIYEKDGKLTPFTAAVVVALFGAIVLTHALTSAIALAIILALTLTGRLKQQTLPMTLAMIFAAWQAYGASSLLSFKSETIRDGLFEPIGFFNQNVGNRLAGSADHVLVGNLKMLMSVLAFAIGALGLGTVLAARHGSNVAFRLRTLIRSSEPIRTTSRRTITGPTLSVSFALLSLFALFALTPIYAYGGEILIRVLLFSLPALGILAVAAMSSRAGAVLTIGILAIAVPLHMVTHYGNELYDYVSPGEIEGFEFITNELPSANVYGGYPGGAFQNTKQLDWRHAVVAGKNKLPSIERYIHPDSLHWDYPDRPTYVAIGRGDDAGAQLFYDMHGFGDTVRAELGKRCNFDLVFENEDYAVYEWHEACA